MVRNKSFCFSPLSFISTILLFFFQKISLFCMSVICSVIALNLTETHGNDSSHGKRIKRENYRLNISNLRQPYVYDCCPTAVQCILQYFGYSTEVRVLRVEIGAFTHRTSFNWGQPRSPEGSELLNVLGVFNRYIRSQNLNNNRQYRLTHIIFGMELDVLIRESLRQNMPLIIATSGHVVVINGIQGNTIEYMDPADGAFHTVDYEQMVNGLRNASYLIHYDSGLPLHQNTVEVSAMCLGTRMPIADFPSCFSSTFRYNRRKRSSMETATNNKIIIKRSSDSRDTVYDSRDNNDLLEPNWDNLYFEPERDAFVVTCRSGPNQITFTISLRTALGLARVYMTRTQNDFIHYATALCWQMRQKDETCWGGHIHTSDHIAMAEFLNDNFKTLKERIVSLMESNGRFKSVRIVTDRNKSMNEFELVDY